MVSTRSFLVPVLAATLLTCSLAGCGGDAGGTHPIETVRELDEQRPANKKPRTDAERFGGGPTSADPHAAHGGAPGPGSGGFGWTLPEGWSEKAPTSLRQGNFAVAGKPDVECYLTALQGTGGGLEANLNRWRQQMGQPALTGEEIDALPRITLLGQKAPYIEIRGPYSGMGASASEGYVMAAVALELPAAAIFVKLIGPAGQVDPELENFKALTRSIRIGVPASPAKTAKRPEAPNDATHGAKPPAHGGSPVKWTTPKGWVQGKPRNMRLVTLHPEGHPEAECYVTVLSGDGGGFAANLNRWQQQMGQPALDAAGLDALPKIEVLGEPTALLEVGGKFTGMGDQAQEGAMLLGVVAPMERLTLFVKMTGPAAVIRAEKATFIRFCGTLE